MSTERCKHDFLLGQCGSCKEKPERINEQVFATKTGQVFHNWVDCAFLRIGQSSADSQGLRNHPIERKHWSSVFWTLGPCEWCCAFYNIQEETPIYCEAEIDGRWVTAQKIKERFTIYGHREIQV